VKRPEESPRSRFLHLAGHQFVTHSDFSDSLVRRILGSSGVLGLPHLRAAQGRSGCLHPVPFASTTSSFSGFRGHLPQLAVFAGDFRPVGDEAALALRRGSYPHDQIRRSGLVYQGTRRSLACTAERIAHPFLVSISSKPPGGPTGPTPGA
jgi:hypothetical protein